MTNDSKGLTLEYNLKLPNLIRSLYLSIKSVTKCISLIFRVHFLPTFSRLLNDVFQQWLISNIHSESDLQHSHDNWISHFIESVFFIHQWMNVNRLVFRICSINQVSAFLVILHQRINFWVVNKIKTMAKHIW